MAAKIIKGGGADKGGAAHARHVADAIPDSGGVVHKRVMDAQGQADKILVAAEEEAGRIRDEARRVLEDAKSGRDEAIRKGYAEGESKGLAQVTEKLIMLDELRRNFYDQAEPEVIKLVMSIAEKVIGRAAAENPELIKGVVHQALEKALGDRITVKLNPEDYKSMMSGEHEFRDLLDKTRRLLFREDGAIAKGGCVVETEVGTIDAQIETQLAAIRKALGVNNG
ncbi:MAG: FliH/SctL family protein [Pseudomonadota bacterium]